MYGTGSYGFSSGHSLGKLSDTSYRGQNIIQFHSAWKRKQFNVDGVVYLSAIEFDKQPNNSSDIILKVNGSIYTFKKKRETIW